jgi:hypothetical protein
VRNNLIEEIIITYTGISYSLHQPVIFAAVCTQNSGAPGESQERLWRKTGFDQKIDKAVAGRHGSPLAAQGLGDFGNDSHAYRERQAHDHGQRVGVAGLGLEDKLANLDD